MPAKTARPKILSRASATPLSLSDRIAPGIGPPPRLRSVEQRVPASQSDCQFSRCASGFYPMSSVPRRTRHWPQSNCDPAEPCNGVSPTYPADVHDPDGTPCASNNPCVTWETCSGGICSGRAHGSYGNQQSTQKLGRNELRKGVPECLR